MPEVGLGDVSYPKFFAVLLPVFAPLFVVVGQGIAWTSLNWDALFYGACCSALGASMVAAIYPKDGRHYGLLSGVFTVLTFV